MRNLKDISTNELVNEILRREKVRSATIETDEGYRLTAMGLHGEKGRYLRGNGPAIVLEIRK